ncbi:MAG: redoxin domain-containing protein [Verrucomicrobia bacterium]|nr:redoxin domain-containing protein [Verrucomicrobiota bacterium]
MKARILLALASLVVTLGPRAAENPPTLALGSPAPDFDLPGVDGRNWKLSDFAAARVLVVVFTCNHCPTAQYYEERVKQFVAEYRDRGVALVAISPNDPKAVRLDELGWAYIGDSFAEMKLHAAYRAFNFPYLYAGDHEAVSRAYGPVATPHAFVFDAARRLRYVGAIDDSERPQHVKRQHLREVVDALLAGQEPPVTRTRAVGCSVKWSDKENAVQAFMDKLAAEPVTVAPADAATLAALRKNDSGKFRLVNFWATWCAPCVVEFPEFVAIHRMYRHRDFEFVSVAINRPDEEAQVLAFLKKHQASNRNLILASSERGPLMDAFDPDWPGAVPFTVLLSPEGEVLYRRLDAIDPIELRRLIVRVLNERKPW